MFDPAKATSAEKSDVAGEMPAMRMQGLGYAYRP